MATQRINLPGGVRAVIPIVMHAQSAVKLMDGVGVVTWIGCAPAGGGNPTPVAIAGTASLIGPDGHEHWIATSAPIVSAPPGVDMAIVDWRGFDFQPA